jgi:hypothetical protein
MPRHLYGLLCLTALLAMARAQADTVVVSEWRLSPGGA